MGSADFQTVVKDAFVASGQSDAAAERMAGLAESMRQYDEDPDAWWACVDPELAAWRVEDTVICFAKHPFFFPGMRFPPEELNAQFAHKREAIRRHLAAGDPGLALIFYESPYRLDALIRMWASRAAPSVVPLGMSLAYRVGWPGMTVEQLRECLADAWMHTELPGYQGRTGLLYLFRAAGWTTDLLDDDGAPTPRPEIELTLYRGVRRRRDGRGLSWTTDPTKAAWFAGRWRRSGKPGYVFRTRVKPDALLARFVGRGEAEYVLDTQKRWKVELVAEFLPEPRP